MLMKQMEDKLTARKNSYLRFLNLYPLHSTLLVLKEYEDKELYLECNIIKKALEEHRDKVKDKFPLGFDFPLRLETYNNEKNRSLLLEHDLLVDEKSAEKRARIIKSNLPIK